MPRPLLLLLAALAAFGGALPAARAAAGEPVLVFAAASLKDALDAASADYMGRTGAKITVSYAASSALARQIESGAPADLFFSADLDWMDYLQDRRLIQPETRVTLLGNTLVLIAPAERRTPLPVEPGFPLAAALAGGRLAMAATASVPAGRYGKAALETLGVWASVAGSLAETENVRAALALVARGEAPLGVVYGTDAQAEPDVVVAGVFPETSHPPILYPAALTASARPQARGFLAFLASDAARPFFEAAGFRVVAPNS